MVGELLSGWRGLYLHRKFLALQKTRLRYIRGTSLVPVHLLCFKVHPKLLTEALMEASDAKVVVAKVVGGKVEQGRVKGVELENGQVLPCDVAVLCMGPWTGGFSSIQIYFQFNPQNRDWSGGVCLVLALGGTGLTGGIIIGKICSLENKSQCDLSAAT